MSAQEHSKMVTYRCAMFSSSLHLVSNKATSCTSLSICSSCFLLILTKSRFSIRNALASNTPQSGALCTFAKGAAGRVGEDCPFTANPSGGGGGGKLSSECMDKLSSLDRAELKACGGWSSENDLSNAERFSSEGTS